MDPKDFSKAMKIAWVIDHSHILLYIIFAIIDIRLKLNKFRAAAFFNIISSISYITNQIEYNFERPEQFEKPYLQLMFLTSYCTAVGWYLISEGTYSFNWKFTATVSFVSVPFYAFKSIVLLIQLIFIEPETKFDGFYDLINDVLAYSIQASVFIEIFIQIHRRRLFCFDIK